MEDLDPEEARAIVDPALKLMIDALHRHDGYIVQSTASPPSHDSSSEPTASRRLILHDISVTGPGPIVDPYSRPVLNYAVKMLRQEPATVVYVSGQGDRATVQRQARAVAQYLEVHGIAASRLVVRDAPVTTPATVSKGPTAAGIVVLNLATAGRANCPS